MFRQSAVVADLIVMMKATLPRQVPTTELGRTSATVMYRERWAPVAAIGAGIGFSVQLPPLAGSQLARPASKPARMRGSPLIVPFIMDRAQPMPVEPGISVHDAAPSLVS